MSNFQAGVKKCELVCFGVKIMIFCFFGVKKSGISVFLVSVENGAGVNKMGLRGGFVFKMHFIPFLFGCL